MAYSYKEYVGDGSTDTFAIPFDYIASADISVFIDGVADTGFTFTTPSSVQTSSVPSAGAVIRVARSTDITSRAVDFASGSILTEEDLDNSNIQVFYAAQEATDTAEEGLFKTADGKFDAQSRVIKNVADPVDAQDAATKNWVETDWLSPSDKAQLNAIDTAKLHTVANDIANVNTTAGSITNVNTTAGAISNVNTVAGSITNVNTTATNIADVNTVATNIADINTVENSIANVNTTATNISDVNTVATNIGDINTVENSIANVNKVGTDIANVNTTAGSIANVNTVATNVADVNTTAGAIANVNAVGTNIANVNSVAGNATNINAVKANETNINAVNANSGNINTVAGNNTNVTTVATNIANVNTVATDISKINQVATDIADVKKVADDLLETTSEIETVAASIANVDAVGTNISNVNTVASNLTSVNSFHDTYTIAATAPTTGLNEGDLWFDTTNDKMMVYNGGSWQNAGSSVNGTAARFKFTATASQTAFTGADANGATLAYDSGYIDVYLNGVHLDPSDYTATDGSTITLAAGAAAGDELYVVAFGTFTLATHYSSAQLDGGQLDNRYYTETEVDTLLSGIDATTLKDSSSNVVADASSGNLVLGDNKKAIFGAGSDLQIYHDGSHSFINDLSGTGDLYIRGSSRLLLQDDVGDSYLIANKDGAVDIYHNGSKKLATTSTGVSVTGSITATAPVFAPGSILQVVRFNSSDATNVTVANTWVDIAATSVTITAKGNNSKFLYVCDTSYESDVGSSYNSFFRVLKDINGGGYNTISKTVRNGNNSMDSTGTGSTSYSFVDTTATSPGDVLTYRMQYNKSNSGSIYFNQQNLGGQPAGTTNHCGGYIMEIAV